MSATNNVTRGKIILFCGPPGCGKGVQGKLLAKERGFVHISTGDLFRDAARQKTEMGLIADAHIRQGKFVPDELVVKLVKEKLNQPEVIERGIILDGFPRTERQARVLTSLVNIDRLILFQISDAICVDRVLGRRIDPETEDVYHLQFMPPTPDISRRLVRREYDLDDKVVRKRIEGYYAQLGHILGHFRNKIQVVNAFLPPQEVHQTILNLLDHELPPINENDINNNPPVNSPPEASSQSESTPKPALLCTVCYDAPADFLVVPCGHQCACEKCLNELRSTTGLCPICRTGIQHIVQVFACGIDEESSGAPIDPTKNTPAVNEVRRVADAGGWGDEIHGDEEKAPASPHKRIQEEIVISIAPAEDVGHQSLSEPVVANVAVTIKIPEHNVREPVDICCIVDVSGSMSSQATYENEAGIQVNDGLTMLDIVIHSVKSVIHLLQENDRLAIVSFSDAGHVVFALGEMTEGGKAQAIHALEGLHASGGTNLWGGLLVGMDALKGEAASTRKKSVLLLTDGQPTVTPPKGFVGELQLYLETHADFTYQVNTFGFGYGLSSDLLRDLAKEGNGTFSFIPDARIVGTCFINCVANVVTNFTQKSSLHLIVKNGCEFAGPVAGELQVLETAWGRVASLGPLLHGQVRTVVVPLRIPPGTTPYLDVVLSWPDPLGYGEIRVNATATERSITEEAVVAFARCLVVSKTLQAIELGCTDKGNAANNVLMTLRGQIASLECLVQNNPTLAHARMTGLKEDVDGRITKALNGKDRFNRWGRHYLRAVTRAHQIELCTNFMDPGLQPYGSEFFKTVVEEGGRIFLALPPPVKKNTNQHQNTRLNPTPAPASTSVYHPPAPPTAMDTYYAGSGGGCFGPTSLVEVRSDSGKENISISDLRAGNFVRVAGDGYEKVKCVIEIYDDDNDDDKDENEKNNSKSLLVMDNGLSITSKHPVRINGKWHYPETLTCIQGKTTSKIVFNVVLEACHIMLVNGMECCTWGHNINEDQVISHPFYGTNQILDKLQTLPGWKEGYIRVKKSVKSS